jgi:hypothetical protein
MPVPPAPHVPNRPNDPPVVTVVRWPSAVLGITVPEQPKKTDNK